MGFFKSLFGENKPTSSTEISFGIANKSIAAGTLSLSVDDTVRVTVPKSPTRDDLQRLRRDCEIILDRVEKRPAELLKILNEVGAGDLATATTTLSAAKLTEEDFLREGGGVAWLAVLVFLAAMAYAKNAK